MFLLLGYYYYASLHTDYSLSERQVVNQSQILIKESQFIRSFAVGFRFDLQVGGAIFCDASSVTVDTCYFLQNYATHAGALGCLNSALLIQKTKFNQNTANNDIGAVWAMSNNETYITETNFMSNTASQSFGAILVNCSYFSVDKCNFELNTASTLSTCIGICNAYETFLTNSYFQKESLLELIYYENNLSYRSYLGIGTCFFNTNLGTNLAMVDGFLYIEVYGCTCGTAPKYLFVSKDPTTVIQWSGTIKPNISDVEGCYSVFKTPYPSPLQTVAETPYITAISTPQETVFNTPFSTPYETNYQTVAQTPNITPESTPFSTPFTTAIESPEITPQVTPPESELPTPSQSFDPTPEPTPERTESMSPTPEDQDMELPDMPSDLGLGLGLGLGLLLILIIIIVICCCCCKKCKDILCCIPKCCFKCCKVTCCNDECCDCFDCCSCSRDKDSKSNTNKSYYENHSTKRVFDLGNVKLPGREECVIVLNPMWRNGSGYNHESSD